jgi:hypothetical protein
MEVHLISDGLPGPEHRDSEGNCWWGDPCGVDWYEGPCWNYGSTPDPRDTCWMAHDAMSMPLTGNENDDDADDDADDHPSLSAAERNPGLGARMGV